MPLPLLLLAVLETDPAVAGALSAYRERTRAEIACAVADAQNEIIVCSLRDADRYRVPYVSAIDDDDPRKEGVTGPFLTGCGAVGVSVSVGGDGRVESERKMAP